MGEVLLTKREVADRLRISVRTLETWRLDGEKEGPKGRPVGGRIRYREADVEAYIRSKFEDAPEAVAS